MDWLAPGRTHREETWNPLGRLDWMWTGDDHLEGPSVRHLLAVRVRVVAGPPSCGCAYAQVVDGMCASLHEGLGAGDDWVGALHHFSLAAT